MYRSVFNVTSLIFPVSPLTLFLRFNHVTYTLGLLHPSSWNPHHLLMDVWIIVIFLNFSILMDKEYLSNC